MRQSIKVTLQYSYMYVGCRVCAYLTVPHEKCTMDLIGMHHTGPIDVASFPPDNKVRV